MKLDRQTLLELDDETRLYQEMSSNVKFKQNLVQGIGGASVFGVAAAVGTALFAAAKTAFLAGGMTAAFPFVAGVALIAAVGIGCLYFGSKFYAESIRMDQIHQAKQITNGMRGVSQAPVIDQQKPIAFPAQDSAHAPVMLDKPATMTPASKIDERVLFDRVVNTQKEAALV